MYITYWLVYNQIMDIRNEEKLNLETFSLQNELALITGGGTGIGKSIATCMVKAGARVVLAGRRRDVLEQTCADLGPRTDMLVYDVTQTGESETLVTEVRKNFGDPTILVNNAGNHLKKMAAETSDAELMDILQVHLMGSYAMARAVIPGMIEQGHGHILFITSMAAVFGIPQVSAYAAAKSAQLGLVRSLATEWSPKGIRVNAIAPGWIKSDMSSKALEDDPERKRRILSRTPLGELGDPDDIGWAAVYLSSPAARFVTGHQLIVDGGISIGF